MPRKAESTSVTIRDVAAACGLSMSTVSCALADRDNVRPETKRIVKEAAALLGYFPSHVAQGLRTGKSWTIGAIVSDISNPFYGKLLRGAQETLAEFGYHLILCSTDYDPAKQTHYIHYLSQRRVDGLLIAPTASDSADIVTLAGLRLPFVMLLRSHDTVSTDYVGVDNTAGMRTVMEHLWQMGHRRIGLILGRHGASPTVERLAAYRAFLAERGQAEYPGYVEYGDYSLDAGVYAARKMLRLDPRPTAIATANDLTALGVMKSCNDLQLKVPQELSLVGWDDIFVAGLPNIELTTLRVPKWELGMTAARLLQRRIESQDASARREQIRFKGELVVRHTTSSLEPD